MIVIVVIGSCAGDSARTKGQKRRRSERENVRGGKREDKKVRRWEDKKGQKTEAVASRTRLRREATAGHEVAKPLRGVYKVLSAYTLVQKRISTTQARRTQRIVFLFLGRSAAAKAMAGQVPRNKKILF